MPFGVEDAWFVDCGLQSVLIYPDSELTADVNGTVTFIAASPIFASSDVGKVIRMGGGIGTVTSL